MRQETIFVVDDTPENLGILVTALEYHGFKVYVISNAAAAYEAIKQVLPDIILLDVMMPEVNGFQVCQQLKADAVTREIPVIFLTALVETVDEVKGLELGAVDYISKPFRLEIVLARVRTHLKLRRLQVELQSQNTQNRAEIVARRRIETALRRSQRIFKRILASLEQVVLLIDPIKQTILMSNPAMQHLFGYQEQDVSGKPLRHLYHNQAMYDQFTENMQIAIHAQEHFRAQAMMRRQDGSAFLSAQTASEIVNDTGETIAFLLLIQDITEQKKSEEAIRHANTVLSTRVEELSQLNQIAQTVASLTNLQTMLDRVSQHIAQLLQVPSCAVALLNSPHTLLTVISNYRADASEPSLEGAQIQIADNPLATQLLNAGQALIVNDLEHNPTFQTIRGILAIRKISSLLIIPLMVRGQIIGLISIGNDRLTREFSATDIRLVETVAGQIAGAITNARLFEEEQRQRQLAESLREVSAALNSSLNLKTILTTIFEHLQRVIQYNSGAIFLQEDSDLVLKEGFNIKPDFVGWRLPLSGSSPEAEAIMQRQTLIIGDVHHDPRWEVWEGGELIQSWMGVPLFYDDQPIGLLTVDSFTPHNYTDEDARVLQTFAAQAAIAIWNAQIYQDIKREKRFFETLMLSSPVATVLGNPDNQILLWNPAAEALFGYPQQDAIGRNLHELVTSATASPTDRATLLAQLAQGGNVRMMTQYQRQNGDLLDVDLSAVPILLDGKQVGVFALYHDITEIKRAEAALRGKNTELQATLDDLQRAQTQLIESEKMAALGKLVANIAHEMNTPLGAIQSSSAHIINTIKEIVHTLPGLLEQLPAVERAAFFHFIARACQEKPHLTFRVERQLRRTVSAALAALNIAEPDMVARSLVDIGVSDELTQFIDLLRLPNHLRLLKEAANLLTPFHLSQNILRAVERTSKIIFALKMYARMDASGIMSMTNVTDGLDVALTLYANQLQARIDVVKRYQNVPELLAFPDELHQVWGNLIYNAIQAMQGAGRLEIEVARQDAFVVVRVIDSGSGIAPDIREHIFEPFFTTRTAGEGSGLGLHICEKIIAKHYGRITFESQPGRTIFSVFLPIREKGQRPG